MSRKLLYIVNPVSGTGTKAPVHDLIRSKTEAAGFPFAILPSVASGDYNFLLEEITSQHFTDIVIAGGDGTVNQVVHALSGLDLQFGILPCGSGNGLAFSAGIPKNLDKAIDIVFRGHGVRSDAFMINDRFACMLCGLGFDAQVAHDFANDPNRGLATYIRQTVKNFFSARTWPFVITTGTREIHSEAFFISIANSNQFGNHFTIAPQASLTDGLLDIVILTKQNKLSMLFHAALQVAGLHGLQHVDVVNEKASLIYFQTPAITIRNEALAPMHIDGDPYETFSYLDVRVLKNYFRLVHP